MTRLLPAIFAAAFLLTLAGSISHVAWFFGRLEADQSTPLGLLIALGLDSVIGAVTLAQVEYRHRGEAIPRSMIVLLVGLVAVSAAANYLHADAYNSISSNDWRRVLTNLLGALPLPFSQLLYVEVAVAAHRPTPQPASDHQSTIQNPKSKIVEAAQNGAQVGVEAVQASRPLTPTERSRLSRQRRKEQQSATA